MTSELIWLHPDCLSATNPAFQKYPHGPAIFIWDEEEIEAERWSLKRIAFLYETLLELPVEIHRGNIIQILSDRPETKIVTVDSVNPRFALHRQALKTKLEVLPATPFVNYRGTPDLKRFSRYWKQVEPILFDK